MGTCCGFAAASDVRHRGIGFTARVRHDGTLLWLLLLLLLIPFGREISWTLLEEATPGLAERLRERLQNSEVNARMRLE